MQEYPLVSIQCLVYNHEPYLRQCLDGFVMQKTNFKFEAIVHDDKSTDGSAKIIAEYAEKYPEIIRPIYETENQYSKRDGSLERIINQACRGKYIALCEGDDYWTDPMKLQKQVDFLENNLDYSMCFHSAIEHYEHKDIPDKVFSKIRDKDYSGRFLFKNWIVPTASVLYRVSVVKSDLYKKVLNCKDFIYGDTPLFVTCAEIGKVRGMSDVMSVYRRNEGGITFGPKSTEAIKKFVNHILSFPQIFGELYSNDSRLLVGRYLSDNVLGALRRGECETARNIHSLTPSNCKYLYWLSNLFYPIRILFRWYAKFVRK